MGKWPITSLTACLLLQACNSPEPGRNPQEESTTASEVWLTVDEYSGPGNCSLRVGDSRKTIEGVTAGPWVPAWNGFAVVREGRLYSLSANGEIIGPKGVAAPEQAWRSGQWSVSPDGSHLAEFDHTDPARALFAVREVETGRTLTRLERQDLERAIGKPAHAIATIAYEGVAWSPSGDRVAFAHGFGGEVDYGGTSESRIAVWSKGTRKVTEWPVGAPPDSLGGPVVWLSEDMLLVHGGLGHRFVRSSGPGRLYEDTAMLTWDGEDLIVLRSIPGPDIWSSRVRLERWTPDLSRRISARVIPGLGWSAVNRGVFFAYRGEGK